MLNNGLVRNGTTGDDVIDLRFQAPWDVRDNANGLAGNDTIYGNVADNNLNGGTGDDEIYGSWGRDTIHGGANNDYLDGQEDDDTIFGDDGNDSVLGGGGNDLLDGGAGGDFLMGDTGNDVLNGGDGNDTLFGDQADPNIGSGVDVLNGGNGNDTLQGGGGADVLSGDEGQDIVNGGSGNDILFDDGIGANDTDVLHGGDGNDRIIAFSGTGQALTGTDQYFGDAGNDTFVIDVRHLRDTGVQIHGGSGADTLEIDVTNGLNLPGPGFSLGGLGAHVDGIEHIDITDAGAQDTLNMTFRDVMNVGSGHVVTIDGNRGDTVNLESVVANDALSGGHWVQGITEATADPTEAHTFFNYEVGKTVVATVAIDTDIDVTFHELVPIELSVFSAHLG